MMTLKDSEVSEQHYLVNLNIKVLFQYNEYVGLYNKTKYCRSKEQNQKLEICHISQKFYITVT